MSSAISGGTAEPRGGTGASIRVMLVDDSAFVRGTLSRILEAEPGLEVVASVGNGKLALTSLDRHDVDVIILDIEMPVMDGMTALPLLLAKKPEVKIIMASTLTAKNAAISIKALSHGATDYISKPTSKTGIGGATEFQRELVDKVKALGTIGRAGVAPVVAQTGKVGRAAVAPKRLYAGAKIELRRESMQVPRVLAIGSSTGGPQALFTLFNEMKSGRFDAPIFVTQHMPPTFTTILAERLEEASGIKAAEGVDGETVTGRRIYVAPGNFHMGVERTNGTVEIRLSDGPQENFCRPSVDPMLRSLVQAYAARVLVVILTGMGHDGAEGARAAVEANGTVIAQNEATSIVWGMPGAVATAGLCSAVLPISDIGPYVLRKFGARRPS